MLLFLAFKAGFSWFSGLIATNFAGFFDSFLMLYMLLKMCYIMSHFSFQYGNHCACFPGRDMRDIALFRGLVRAAGEAGHCSMGFRVGSESDKVVQSDPLNE